MKIQRVLVLLFSFVWLQACTVSGPVHLYSGKPRSNSETALLRVPGPITVTMVDGKKVDVPSVNDGFYEIHLLPGVHRINFKYEKYWGDELSGMLVKSDVVGVEDQFFAGKSYELTYSVPEDEEAAFDMPSEFKAKLVEKKTGRQIASNLAAESAKLNVAPPAILSSKNTLKEKVNPVANTTPKENALVPSGINVDTAVSKNAVKRMKFWWLMANEEERKQIKKWIKSVEAVK